MTSEFELYCDNDWKKGLLGTMLFLVSSLMTLLVGVITNNLGRKTGIIFSYSFGMAGVTCLGLVVINY